MIGTSPDDQRSIPALAWDETATCMPFNKAEQDVCSCMDVCSAVVKLCNKDDCVWN